MLRLDHQVAIAALIGLRKLDEVYIPQPCPFLGGGEEPDTYGKGEVWAFAERVGMCHGFGGGAEA